MTDNGLPKATMVNFIKEHISDKRKVSAEFTNMLLDLSKQFIDKVSAQANQICEKQGKKTINNEHFFGALKTMGMGDIIKQLQKTDQNLKIKQQKKHEDKLRVQECIQKIYKQQSKLNDQNQHQHQHKEKIKLPKIQTNSKHKPIQLEDQQDFIQILQNCEDDQLSEMVEQK